MRLVERSVPLPAWQDVRCASSIVVNRTPLATVSTVSRQRVSIKRFFEAGCASRAPPRCQCCGAFGGIAGAFQGNPGDRWADLDTHPEEAQTRSFGTPAVSAHGWPGRKVAAGRGEGGCWSSGPLYLAVFLSGRSLHAPASACSSERAWLLPVLDPVDDRDLPVSLSHPDKFGGVLGSVAAGRQASPVAV